MKLDGLQAGRAIAALMVVVFHANVFILPEKLYAGTDAGSVFNMGYAGVEFFFVLSGFIMIYVHRKDFGIPDRASAFMQKRILRIYPIYWLVYAALTLGYFALPAFGPEHARDPEAILTSFLLFPMPDQPVMRVAWTLQHEMLFYSMFTIFIVNLRVGMIVFAIWMAACFLLSWSTAYPSNFLFSPYNILFLMGIIAAFLYERIKFRDVRKVFFVGMTIFFGVGLSEVFLTVWDMPLRTWAYGVGATAIVAGLAAGAVRSPGWLVFLGNASYAIYLVHLPVMSVGVVLLAAAGAPWSLPPLAMLTLMVALATGSGALVHVLLEKPLLERLTMRRHAAA